MERAVALAIDAAAFASPNPTVGCVLVRDGRVLGEGAHFYEARDHAEIAALHQAAARGEVVQGASAYVTLEPCSHQGRTGPCADALLRAGITRCVVATIDPNPSVRGQGVAKLRAGGVQVDLLPVHEDVVQRARRLNDAFAFAIRTGRPFVTLKAAVSADGMLAPAARKRSGTQPHWLTGELARADVQQLRHANDALLTGIGTILADDPALSDRTGLPRRKKLLRVVLDSELRLPRTSRLVRSSTDDLLVICSQSAAEDREAALTGLGVEIARVPNRGNVLDLQVVLAALARRGVRSVLTEAGTLLNGGLLRTGFADKLIVYHAPVQLGEDALPFAAGLPVAQVERQLTGVERIPFAHGSEQDVRLSGYLHDPWQAVQYAS